MGHCAIRWTRSRAGSGGRAHEDGRAETAGPIPWASPLLALLAGIVYLVPGLASSLQFDLSAIAAGEGWRIVTGHWTHVSLDHLLWDAAVFAALGFASERRSLS